MMQIRLLTQAEIDTAIEFLHVMLGAMASYRGHPQQLIGLLEANLADASPVFLPKLSLHISVLQQSPARSLDEALGFAAFQIEMWRQL